MAILGTNDVTAQVQELRRLRREAAWWRGGAAVVVAATVLWSVSTLRNSTQALLQEGRPQDEFTSSLTAGLQTDVVPMIQEMTGRTLTELRPQLITAFNKAAQRAPEIANRSEQELQTLQKDVASRSEQALDATFTKALHDREPKIKQMFPNVTEDKVTTLVQNLNEIGTQRIASANDRLFSKHLNAMTDIVTNMTKIQETEKIDTKSSAPTYQIATAVLEDLEKQVQGVKPAVEADKKAILATSEAITAAQTAATTAGGIAPNDPASTPKGGK